MRTDLISILAALDRQEMSGHTYTDLEYLRSHCDPVMSEDEFAQAVEELVQDGVLSLEEDRVYHTSTLCYENAAAEFLAKLLSDNNIGPVELPPVLKVGALVLTPEQREAVHMGLSHRISLILGGVGTGKAAVIQALAELQPVGPYSKILCSPTGKGARHLHNRIGLPVRTVHSALAKRPSQNLLGTVLCPFPDLVVVGEAELLTTKLLAGLLNKMSPSTRIVLIGDPEQLQPTDSGNILHDLMQLGFPSITLPPLPLQRSDNNALTHNVRHFSDCHSIADLRFDSSFQMLVGLRNDAIRDMLLSAGETLYRSGADVQVLSSLNNAAPLFVGRLNLDFQKRLNPACEANTSEAFPRNLFRTGDRVTVTQNDPVRRLNKGDIGQFRFMRQVDGGTLIGLFCTDGREAFWMEEPRTLALAYAMSVHRAQSCRWDTMVIPISGGGDSELTRRMIYTAISRARKRVILIGDPDVLDDALATEPPPRRSMLVYKTRMHR